MRGDLSPSFALSLTYDQIFRSLPIPTASFTGKTVIVTGSNVGLGLEASKHIAKLGASKLILAVRSVEKGEAAKNEIEESTKCDPSVIEVWPLDLSVYESVQEFAARASNELERLDVLLENAGVISEEWKLAEDNEITLTVNVVSTFLLAFLLLPKLKETAAKFDTRPNLTFVTSDTHLFVDFNERNASEGIFNAMNDKAQSGMGNRYPTSKLMEIYVAREMTARKPADSYPVTINLVNPGLCHSELTRELNLAVKLFKLLFARTTEAGSRALVHGASAGPETHGEYMNMCEVAQTATIVTNDEGQRAQKRVWDELMEKLEKISPGVSAKL